MKKGVVIGGGIAGLVSASILSAQGYEITLIERNETLGGKLQDIQLGDYRFDFGPSTLTMPWVFERVFREARRTIDPDLHFVPIAVNNRNFFAGGTIIDLSADPDYMAHQLANFSKENRQGFISYLNEVKQMYEIVESQFFENPVVKWKDYFSPNRMKALLKVHPFQSMDSFHQKYFDDPRLIAMMNRYATYVGSSPYETPATLSLVAYLELVQGVYYIEGGNYRLIEALVRLAEETGVKVLTGCPVEQIVIENGKVVGVTMTDREGISADFVVSNVDIRTTQESLFAEQHKRSVKDIPSVSGFVTLLGVKKKYPHLHHHNIFFPEDYGREFVDIFEQRRWSLSPSIYLCNSSFSEPEQACQGLGSNLSILVNVPANQRAEREESWFERYYQYRDQIIHWLETYWGMADLEDSIVEQRMYGPKEIESMSGAWQGSLYGPASHGSKAFRRPPMKDPKYKGLYYTGGTTHPGGGAPMAALSGMTVAQVIQQETEDKTQSTMNKEIMK